MSLAPIIASFVLALLLILPCMHHGLASAPVVAATYSSSISLSTACAPFTCAPSGFLLKFMSPLSQPSGLFGLNINEKHHSRNSWTYLLLFWVRTESRFVFLEGSSHMLSCSPCWPHKAQLTPTKWKSNRSSLKINRYSQSSQCNIWINSTFNSN